MKIRRKIKGMVIETELTKEEMSDAYYEQDELFMKQDCLEHLNEEYNEEDPNCYKKSEIPGILPFVYRLFKKYRENDEGWSFDLQEAVKCGYEDYLQSKLLKEKDGE